LGLNCSFESIGGSVDIDWMLRSAFFGAGSFNLARSFYILEKYFWNSVNMVASTPKYYEGKITLSDMNPFTGMYEPGHWNAPDATTYWLHNGQTIEQIFSPALEECKRMCN
jgi:hypothetical protein